MVCWYIGNQVMIDLLSKAKQSTFAELVGVTQQAISKHYRNGVLKHDGTYDEWVKSYCEHLRIEAAGRDVAEDIKQATIREKNANAAKKELETDILSKRVVDRGEVFQELEPAVLHIKTTLMNSGEKIAAAIKATHGIEIDKHYIDDQHRNALSEIARYAPECAGTGGRSDEDAETAA